MKKAAILIIIVAAICAIVALKPQVEEIPAEPEQTAVAEVCTACPRQTMPPKRTVLLTVETPTVTPQPTPVPTELPAPSESPEPIETPMPEPTEVVYTADTSYVPGFGYIESQGAGTCTIADSIYENGNKVGIMD